MKKIKPINIDYNTIPLSEYPRPFLKRASYMSLNGAWDYEITKDPLSNFEFKNKVIVPYAVETPLSGVNHLLRPDEFLIYNRLVSLPNGFKKERLLLHFEGVDQICDVYINNKKVGHHVGGYTKFSFDISELVNENNFYISVVCLDNSDTSYYSRGKQSLKRGGILYTTTSGIYKSVWLESVGKEYIKEIRYTPLFDAQCLRLKIIATCDGICRVTINNQEVIANSNQECLIKLEEFHPWKINNPYLYNVKIRFFDDEVTSYFGMRKIELKKGKDGHSRFYLNNELVFLKGILDQGYYYLGNLTPKDYRDYLDEIQSVKSLGFNTLRVHVKTESDLFYYYCDREGILLIQDFINGGEKYSKKVIIMPGVFRKMKGKKDYKNLKFYGRKSILGQNNWIKESLEMQKELYNHPSIVIYSIFNEAWGQFHSIENYLRFKNNDPTRFYDTTSGWIDFGKSDFVSTHNYFFKNKIHPDRFGLNRPQLLSEYGGFSLLLKDHFFGRKIFGYRRYNSMLSLSKHYAKLHTKFIIPMIKEGLMGAIYTQLSDVEDEVNGLYTFDREILKIDKETIIYINELIDEENAKLI